MSNADGIADPRAYYAQGVLPVAVANRAATDPDRTALQVVGEPPVSYAELDGLGLRWAGALRGAGVEPGHCVATMMTPSLDGYAAWLGISWLRGYDTGVNPEFRGAMLAYILSNCKARIAVVDARWLPRVLEVADQAPELKHIVVSCADGPLPKSRLHLETVEQFLAAATPIVPDAPGPSDIGSVTYTSGTTGPSKGVLFSWAQFFACATGTIPFEDLQPGDVFYSTATMHHGSGRLPLLMMALCGGTLVARDRFSGSEFWDDVHTYGCTLGAFIGAMSHFVWSQPPSPTDADNSMRLAVMFPVIPQHEAFQERFGLKIRTVYSMTEIGPVVGSGWSPQDPTSCGTAQPGYEVRIVGEDDYDVPDGRAGELIVRSEHPWMLTPGYLGMAEATAKAWRNGWFHTGDALRRDADGNYFFLDRLKDAIRRRGENISSAEVEAQVNEHPDVLESAAVALPSEFGEDEIKIVIARRPESDLTPEELIGFLAERMPRFMVPRYVDFVAELPKTDATMRIRKFELREAGITPTTWDREAAGINLER